MKHHWFKAGAPHNSCPPEQIKHRFWFSRSGVLLINSQVMWMALLLGSHLEYRESKPIMVITLPLARDWSRISMWLSCSQRKLRKDVLKGWVGLWGRFPFLMKGKRILKEKAISPPSLPSSFVQCHERTEALSWGSHLVTKINTLEEEAQPLRKEKRGTSLSHQNPRTLTARCSC